MLDHIAKHPRCAVFAAMGSGKSSATLHALQGIELLDEAPGLILGPRRVAVGSTPLEKGVWANETAKWDDLDLDVVPIKGTQTERFQALARRAPFHAINYEQLPWLVKHFGRNWPYRTIVADECFVAGTPVLTAVGFRPIEDIQVGDVVLTHVGLRRVSWVYKRRTDTLKLVSVNLSNGGQLVVTANHPFFTDAGWLPARMCAGRKLYRPADLPHLQREFHKASIESTRSDAARPHSILLSRLPDEGHLPLQSRNAGGVSQEHDGSEQESSDFMELWSAMVRGPSGEDVGTEEGDSDLASRRQRNRNDPHRSIDCPLPPRGLHLELDRAVGESWAWLSLALQARLRQSSSDDLSGGGWLLPSYHARQGEGCSQDGEVTVLGVEPAPNPERRGLAPVFDLEVEGASTYFAGSVLVHNSTRLKGHRLRQGGLRTQMLAKVAFMPHVTRFVALTGTPAPNGLKDLWGQLWFLDRGERLGKTYDAFSSRWFRPSRDGYGLEPFQHSQDEIQDRIRDICITIDPADYGLKLDKVIERTIEVELPAKARETYLDMEKQMYTELRSPKDGRSILEIEAVSAAGRTNKCLQLANGAVYYDDKQSWAEIHTAKFEALESVIEEAGGMPIVVAYQFKSDLERLRRHFPRGMTLDQTTEAAWNEGRVPILFLHPASGGHGLNLQWGSNILVDLSSGWDLEHDDQIIERIGPMRQFQAGLDRPVYRYRIIAVDTVDELVRERRASKHSVQSILLESMKRKGIV